MKKLLPLLLCYALTQTQCFAISGGPNYGNGGVNTVGSYSGIIQGVTEVDPLTDSVPTIPGDPVPGGSGSNSTPSNALGLFDLVVPGTTTASGGFLLFADGRVFSGTISASVDPDSNRLAGILQGSFTFMETFFAAAGTTTTTTVTASAVGSINAKIGASSGRATTAARLNGTANMEISLGLVNADESPLINREITFTVTGFQTTTSTSTLSTLGTAGSNTSTGGQTT